jgi:hypothetical protein
MTTSSCVRCAYVGAANTRMTSNTVRKVGARNLVSWADVRAPVRRNFHSSRRPKAMRSRMEVGQTWCTISTGTTARWASSNAVLPWSSRARPRRPRVASAMRPTSRWAAT